MNKLTEEIRESLKPYPVTGFVGTCVPMPTLEQVGLLLTEVDRLTSELAGALHKGRMEALNEVFQINGPSRAIARLKEKYTAEFQTHERRGK